MTDDVFTIDWMPIETAPMNGTPILLWLSKPLDSNDVCGYAPFRNLACIVGWWDGYSWRSHAGSEEGDPSSGSYFFVSMDLEPSHWHPLPAMKVE
jgi:hypothetical protein